ncbi:phosphomannomutase [Saccharopolyspora antimicrobica]|uniref:Phosphomannomutase n=1 Tax=Saccharopolyspora antimicrobica TaxID=455193 RepID=A0A1I5HDI2_9PSEU|nr:phospho-sugar mutase [Saccharopolyspora antimicrobica]RKT85353.1 phosphomannomutase [Saccharopolyspora antimicrobica]SFO46388.1 phosphomannomutase [Saccharopolyspora antimicrobica]
MGESVEVCGTGARAAAERWIAEDVDPGARAELQRLVDADSPELADRMSGMPRFGTAGLRAAVRAGANGMNRAVVVRTTAGVAEWLNEHGHSGGVVVVGRDARHGSADFAADAAGVLAAAGFDVRVLPEPLPTPVLAHAVRALDAVAGIQITASHNPPQDNGYKLYLRGGIHLVNPTDSEIEAAVAATPAANSVPRAENWSVHSSALEDYLARVATLPRGSARGLRIAATALHGVGAQPLREALHRAGFDDVHLVASQADPDPDFPTVGFPNPEEPGTTDALLELAAEVGADLAIALDPDADRCALGAPVDGVWRMFRGDETGVLLAWHILSTLDREVTPDPLVATTIVSATMLRSIAAEFGVRYDETLTGFKWLVRAGDGAGTGLVYAYEEALGHCVDPDFVRDKDGISTAVLAADLAAALKAAGRALPQLLDELSTEHGLHETGQISVRVSDLSLIPRIMRRLRAQPPAQLAGTAVDVRDLLPQTDALVVTGAGGLRVVIRPSGTEPKLKCYLQVVEQVDDLPTAKRRAADRLAALERAVSELVRGG